MADSNLNTLLKWGLQNSTTNPGDGQGAGGSDLARGLDRNALAQLLGGPSDADRMKEAMAAILSADVSLENKGIAFDNLEQLVENIDNANNMESLGLWTPLVEQLSNPEPKLRTGAAWCLGVAVQNNARAQDKCLAMGAIPVLVKIALDDNDHGVRRKAIFALSSEVRNYQPGLDEFLKNLPDSKKYGSHVDAADMAAVDVIVQDLRENATFI